MSNKVIFLALNELNFDYIKFYVKQGKLPNIAKFFKENKLIETVSENQYKLLEPWIQWVTVHTGLTYDEHQIFRLGDIVDNKQLSQIFEELEKEGKTVGAVSPFNADNRLNNAAFFVPDPWTKTSVTGNKNVKALSDAIQQTVNDNAQSKLDKSSVFSILKGFLKHVSPNRYLHYANTFANVKKPGSKAIILDSLLADVFIDLWKESKPDFSYLFLNSGAHIQHHYLFNSRAYKGEFQNPEWYCPKGYDPLIKIFEEYDRVLGRLVDLGTKIVIATGLHQKPHKHLTYYWRLKKHKQFLEKIGVVNYDDVLPRMSRDFLINAKSEAVANEIEQKLNSFAMKDTNEKVFEVDNRGKSLFVELVYPNDITDDMSIYSETLNITVDNFKNDIAFVAIKNGEHDGIGYLISNADLGLESKVPLTAVKNSVKELVLN